MTIHKSTSLIEILLVISILSTLSLYLFRQTFSLLNLKRYLNNLYSALYIVENRQDDLIMHVRKNKNIHNSEPYTYRIEDGIFNIFVDVKREVGFNDLYKAEWEISWQEGNYKRVIKRINYLRLE